MLAPHEYRKAYAKRVQALQDTCNERLTERRKIFEFVECPGNGILLLGFGTHELAGRSQLIAPKASPRP